MTKVVIPTEPMKTYILNMRDGSRQKITVPATWKTSLGALYPGKDINNGKSAMRFWEGNKEHQRAVIADVESFRDDSLKIEVERTKVHEQGVRARTNLGDKHIILRGEVKQWVNPDDPKESQADPEFLRLTDARGINTGNSKKVK